MGETVRMKIEKFGDRLVTIDVDHPLAIAQRARDAAAKGSGVGSGQAVDSVIAPPENDPSNPPEVGLFDIPPEQREVPKVQAHLESLDRKAIQELAKEHDIAANQSSVDLVEQLTIKLTTPAEPKVPTDEGEE